MLFLKIIGIACLAIAVLLAVVAATAGDNSDARALAEILYFPAAGIGFVGLAITAFAFLY